MHLGSVRAGMWTKIHFSLKPLLGLWPQYLLSLEKTAGFLDPSVGLEISSARPGILTLELHQGHQEDLSKQIAGVYHQSLQVESENLHI